MKNIDGMVGWLVQLVHDAHLSTSLSCCCEYGIAELVFGDNLTTAESKEQTTGLNTLKALGIKTGITLQCVVEGCTMLSKSRRVEYNKIVFILVSI